MRAEAGASWEDVVVTSLAHGLGGLECLSGIPGSAGATPVQNVGAYGVEVADVISRVRLLDRRTGEDELGAAGGLGLRLPHQRPEELVATRWCSRSSSPWMRPDSAPRFATASSRKPLAPKAERASDSTRVRDEVLALRARKGMVLAEGDYDTWSVGSFFTNPVVSATDFARLSARVEGPVPNYPAPDGVKLAAGWLVEHAGFGKGYPGEGASARLSTKHALALTNRGSATTEDLLVLARTVRDGVRDAYGIDLTPEPILVGCVL